MAEFPLHLIPILPFIGAAIALLIGRRLGKNVITLLCCGSVAAAFIVSVKGFLVLHHDLPPTGALVGRFFEAPWIKAGDLNISAGLAMDHLSAILCLVVTGIGFLIHVYSTAYMEHDENYTRFFAFLNLFTGSMLILVLGDSLPVTFVGWEGVGLCSYLLIGFWLDKDANALAGRKAFVVNRIGDFGFLLAMFLIYSRTGTLKYTELAGHIDQLSAHIWFGLPVAYFVGLLVLVGATGKSAQIPLYIWLPDAMAGPTPVSALIHAATMVTAGVYVVARLHFVFEAAPVTLAVVAVVGAITALFAATIGIAQRDMKKVLAYSTVSQLGFMFVGVGTYLNNTHTANYQAGIFHLVTHAFFKACLFLGAGSVMHGLNGEGDIMRMGGLRKWMPHTRWTFLIACLAIAGIFPLSGFWSKDAILGGVWHASWLTSGPPTNFLEKMAFAKDGDQFVIHLGHFLYPVLLLAAGCTAFYMFRLYWLAFGGEYRGPAVSSAALAHAVGDAHDTHAAHGHDDHGHDHAPAHESPPAITVVLWILAIGAIVIGFLGIPEVVRPGFDYFGEWLSPVLPPLVADESASEFWMFAAIALAVSGIGIGLAWVLYGHGPAVAVRNFVARAPRLYRLVFNKYYVDEIYDFLVVRPVRFTAFLLWKAFDAFFIDLILVNGVGFLVSGFGKLSKYLQNGDLQRYIVALIVGGAVIVGVGTHYDVWAGAKFETAVAGRDVRVVAHGAGTTAKRLQYRVDWEGDGKFGATQPSPNFKHTYDKPGSHKIAVEAIDPRWGTVSRESRTVKVQ
ncbi:MAG: proton-translocating NADH-quinone oxidoreductase, chain [Myxococcales bacterium]|nr:proton-translocating NADH-quinone oxidoreductase, chain [Myxococcales bacterium]